MSQEFIEYPLALKISARNKLLQKQLQTTVCTDSDEANEYQLSLDCPTCTLETVTYEQNSSCMLDCDAKNCLMVMMQQFKLINYYSSDFESIRCKQVYKSILEKDPNSLEANFGLAKLFAFEKNLEKAIEHVSKSCVPFPVDSVYLLWKIVLTIFHQKEYITLTPSSYTGIFCTGRTKPDKHRNLADLKDLLVSVPDCIEKYWCYLELSLKRVRNLDPPQYYASRIMEADKYCGYLAWARLQEETRMNEAVKVLKGVIFRYPRRYEAYLILWRKYHYNLKDYNLAVLVIEQAYLKASCDQNNRNLIVIAYAKSLYKRGNLLSAIEILVHSYMSHTEFPAYLKIYGKICIKSSVPEVISSGMSAILEAYKQCASFRRCSINYWIGRAYLKKNEILDSLVYFSKALDTLENPSSYKGVKISKIISRHFQVIEIYERAEDRLRRKVFDELKTLCRLLRDYNVYIADVIQARAYWEEGKKELAISALHECARMSSCKLEAHWLIISWFIKMGHMKEANDAGLEMIHLCNNENIIATDWVKSHLFYSKFLEKNNEVENALLILKCIGKAFPSLPYIQLPYVYRLRNAQSTEELMKLIDEDEMIFTSNTSTQPHDLMKKILNVKQTESRFKLVRHWDPDYIHSHQLDHLISSLPPEFTNTSSDSISYDLEDKQITKSSVDYSHTLDTFEHFSLCSDESFLYEIGKLCSKHKVNISEGLLALSDYITIHIWKHTETPEEKDYAISRAEYLKALLLYHRKEYTDSWDILKRISPKLYEGKDTKLCERVHSLMIKMVSMQLDSLGKVE